MHVILNSSAVYCAQDEYTMKKEYKFDVQGILFVQEVTIQNKMQDFKAFVCGWGNGFIMLNA